MNRMLPLAALLLTTSGAFAIQDELDSAVEIRALQPPADLIDRIEAQPGVGLEGVRPLGDFDPAEYPYRLTNVIMKDGLPYYPYYALREGSQHVVHPMALGRFLLRNAEGEKAEQTVEAAVDIAYELPNGGLAWYYPRHYQVARMLGPNLKYSSISQGTIIAGLTGMSQAGAAEPELADKAFRAMLYPFEDGGVNLANKAVLEMPLFYGPPEIILNGWIDALLHIRDYGEISGNDEAIDFFKSNVEFLADILPNFDARHATISRYSDMSPYRVKVRVASPGDVADLQVLYRPIVDGLPAIKVPLAPPLDPDDFSIYDSQILRQNGREALVWLGCSQMYETVLVSRSEELSVQFAIGEYDRRSTTPGSRGDQIMKESEQDGDYRTVTISKDDGLICGFPTNFSKGGTHNYYHSYHVVGLLLVAMSEQVTNEDRRTLIEWALRWKDDIDHIKETEGEEFRALEDMIGDINANQAKVTYSDFDVLLENALAAICCYAEE